MDVCTGVVTIVPKIRVFQSPFVKRNQQSIEIGCFHLFERNFQHKTNANRHNIKNEDEKERITNMDHLLLEG